MCAEVLQFWFDKAILGRASTVEEIAFLKEPGSRF